MSRDEKFRGQHRKLQQVCECKQKLKPAFSKKGSELVLKSTERKHVDKVAALGTELKGLRIIPSYWNVNITNAF